MDSMHIASFEEPDAQISRSWLTALTDTGCEDANIEWNAAHHLLDLRRWRSVIGDCEIVIFRKL